jgi:hypothetical protein
MNLLASRRDALKTGARVAGAAVAGGAGLLAWRHWRPNAASGIVSAATRQGKHLLVRLDREGRVVWQLQLPVRAHGLALHGPDPQLAVAVARRPGTQAWMVDLAEGRIVRSLPSRPGRHYFGHAVFSPDGQHLLTTENDYERGVGVIGVREASTGRWLGEVSSLGIGPHELRFSPGTDNLVIANGGIHTHPNQQRENLNAATMAPNLVRLDWGRQRLISLDQPVHHQLSVRHIDVTPRGDVAVAMQFEGAAALRATLPTLALRRGSGLEVPAADASTWAALGGYVGSVRASPEGDWAVATSPRGNVLVFWDLRRNLLLAPVQMADVCGVCFSPAGDEVLVSAGSTALRRYRRVSGGWQPTPASDVAALQWDNHADWI